MSAFVAKVADQRAVRLAQLGPGFLALRVVGLGEADGDQPQDGPVTTGPFAGERKSKVMPGSPPAPRADGDSPKRPKS